MIPMTIVLYDGFTEYAKFKIALQKLVPTHAYDFRYYNSTSYHMHEWVPVTTPRNPTHSDT